jgi:hypothetical protein
MNMLNNIAGELLLKAVGLFIGGVLLVIMLGVIALFTPKDFFLGEALIDQIVLLRNERNGTQETIVVDSCGEEGVAPDVLVELVTLPEGEMHPIEQDYKDRLGELEDWYVESFVPYRGCVFMVFGGFGTDGSEDKVMLYKWDVQLGEWYYVDEWCRVCGALDAMGLG